MESNGEGGLGTMEINVATTEGLGRSDIFHIIKEILGFVLYMHHQIPSVLQHLENEFDALKEKCKSLEENSLAPNESNASDRRKQNLRRRETKQGIRRLEKLMCSISDLLSSLQLALDKMPDIQVLTLVLGASLVRPQHVYQVAFSGRKLNDLGSANKCTKSKVADCIARKAIRDLISAGAGSSYTGPSKLFLLFRSSAATFSLPQHFLPKRDFQFSKKVVPLELQIKCKISAHLMDDSQDNLMTDSTQCTSNSIENDVMWFQCKHIVKGLACKTPAEC